MLPHNCEKSLLYLANVDVLQLLIPFFIKYAFQNDTVSYDSFRAWIVGHPNITSVTRWLINASGITVSLTDDTEMPNFYQTLAGVTHCKFFFYLWYSVVFTKNEDQ